MNWTYIVVWFIVTVIEVPCPDRVEMDDFGRTRTYTCTVYHTRLDTVERARVFTDRQSALAFYAQALQSTDGATLDSTQEAVDDDTALYFYTHY